VEGALGPEYVHGRPFQLEQAYQEVGPGTPLLFLLSAGVDPFAEVKQLAAQFGITEANGRLQVVSLGQGQESIAEEAIDQAQFNGNWVFLQNIHLMVSWLPTLALKLEELSCSNSPNPSLRVFLSAAAPPPGCPSAIPLFILQNSFKITTEAPTDFKSNMLRAFGTFNAEYFESNVQQNEFKALVFGLSFFHATLIGRSKYGQQGWSLPYSFTLNDLRVSTDIAFSYLEASTSGTPWEHLRYLIGEIMYGGHVTDPWDRRLLKAQLHKLLREELFEELEIAPGFIVPRVGSYETMWSHVDTSLPVETPALFGLQSNAEKISLSQKTEELFTNLWDLIDIQVEDGSSDGFIAPQSQAEAVLGELREQCPEGWDLAELEERTCDLVAADDPFTNVFRQEILLMSKLLTEIRTSLLNLAQAMSGEVQMSDSAEDLQSALASNRVPARWHAVAYPCCKGLGGWFSDLLERHIQLDTWMSALMVPNVTWLGGLFSPLSFLTAVMQSSARKLQAAIDDMVILTDVTRKLKEDVDSAPREGTYISGMFLEGTSLNVQAGTLNHPSAPLTSPEIHQALAIVHVRAAPSSVSMPANRDGVYACPVYRTVKRGNTYVFTALLKIPSDGAAEDWVISGVALLLESI